MNDFVMTGASPDEVWPLIREHHYSHRMPSNIQHCFVWRQSGGLFGDTGEPVAAVVYGVPVNRNWPTDALELQRLVRHPTFKMPLSELIGFSLRWLRVHTGTPFVLSYADSGKGHHGGIYQASGFIYVAARRPYQDGIRNTRTGEFIHGRQCNRMFGSRSQKTLKEHMTDEWELAFSETKHLYVRPMRQKLKPLLKRFGWMPLDFPKPDNAACLSDAPIPLGASQEHTLEAAP